MSGIIIVAMPISLLANNFGDSYRYGYKKDKVLERYYERMDKIDPSRSMPKDKRKIKQLKAKIKRILRQDD
jgi:hypothetical protein